MAVRQRMDLRQSQSLVMTPQLQQAIKLLELSSQELAAYVERELEQNPLLERDDGMTDGVETAAESGEDPPQAVGAGEPMDASEFVASATMPDAPESPLDLDYDNLWTNDAAETMAVPTRTGGSGRGNGTPPRRDVAQARALLELGVAQDLARCYSDQAIEDRFARELEKLLADKEAPSTQAMIASLTARHDRLRTLIAEVRGQGPAPETAQGPPF